MNIIFRKLSWLARRRDRETELREELNFHLEAEADDRKEGGMADAEARAVARRELGNITLVSENTRAAWGWPCLEQVVRDAVYAVRLLRKAPAFTLIAVLTLALGIGVNSGIFSIINAVILRPLPYLQENRLVAIYETLTGEPPAKWSTSHATGDSRARMPVSTANLADYARQSSLDIAAYEAVAMNLTGDRPPERIFGQRVTDRYFDLLGVAPVQGRAFLPDEQRSGNDHVVILGHELAQRLALSPPASITLEGEKYQVVGTLPAGFESPLQFSTTDRLEFYVPAAYPAKVAADRGMHQMWTVARLRPGANIARAQAELDGISAALARQSPSTNRNVKTVLAPLGADLVRNARTSLLVLLGAVGLLLLIACANLANLLLARGIGRQREISIRIALGASRARVVGELLTQSLVLAGIGCGAGFVLGVWTREALVRHAPPGIPRLETVTTDTTVVLFTIALSLVTGLLFGLFPALQVSKARPLESLKAGGRSAAGAQVMRWRNALMTAEIAVSMILLVGSGLLLRSFQLLNGVDLGFETEHVLAININLPEARYGAPGRRLAFFQELESRVRALPGVQASGFANRMPMRGGWSSDITLEDGKQSGAGFQVVSPGYFATLGIPLLRGRLFNTADREGAPVVAVVNQHFARVVSGSQNPIGSRFKAGGWVTIVGVVGDVRRGGKAAQIVPEVYLAATQPVPVKVADFAFRAAGDPKRLIAAVQQQVWALDKDQPVTNVQTLEDVVNQRAEQRRFETTLLGVFAALALVLALVGIYGVISYSVSQRTGEIGLRLALGAKPADILRLVLLQAIGLAAIGIAIGTVGAFGLSHFLETLLFEIKPGDPLTYLAVALVIGLVTLVACYVPARRAATIDPIVALRYD